MSEPLVSIVCDVYNHGAFLRKCLDGFVMQKASFPFEVLIHDDASTDDSASIIREYEVNYPELFKPIYQTENQYSKGVNLWLDIQFPRAKGRYIAICEGDDYWTDPLKLQKQVDFLETHDGFVMCCTAFSQSYGVEEKDRTIISFDLDEITIDDFVKGQWIGTLTSMFRKDAIRDYAVPFANLPMGDLPLWGHLVSKGRVKYLNDITANYRRQENSASSLKDARKQSFFDLAAMRVREFYAKGNNRIDVARPILSKKAHEAFEHIYFNHYTDYFVDEWWYYVKEYGKPSGYDKLKRWGLKSNLNYFVSRIILRFKHKI